MRKALVALSLILVACDPASEPPPSTPASSPATTRPAPPPSQTPYVLDNVEKATEIEVAAHDGTVVVAYDSNGLALLRDCTGHGRYVFSAAPPESLKKVFVSLSAELPFRGKALEADTEAERGRGAIVTLLATVVGAYTLDHVPARAELLGDCNRATHVVTSMMVGAFALGVDSTGAKASLADSFRITPGPPPTSFRSLATGGDNQACRPSDPSPSHPPPQCSALLRIAVAPLDP